jgi:uncharacterized membrane protein
VPNPIYRFATVSSQGFSWRLMRNCSASPAQLLAVFASLCVVSVGIGVYFWVQGASLVMPFACLEVVSVGLAFVLYARHARDGEKISLQGPELIVERDIAGKHERSAFKRDWVRVEPLAADGSLIELSGQGRRVQVGRYVRPELRALLAQEIRTALRAR